MASQQDLQELLRVITARKVPIMTAMGQVRALQAVSLCSIQQIAGAQPDVVERALGDARTAKSLQSTCKAHMKQPSSKRPGELLSNAAVGKRAKTEQESGVRPESRSRQEREDALALPVVTDEDEIARTSVYTNRAPLMLAFAVELLRFTMPEQPLSSRLSLAQAVVSANSRSKAASLGMATAAAEDESWCEGQPKVMIMGRSVAVLKRGDYHPQPPTAAAVTATQHTQSSTAPNSPLWTVGRQITFKSSTFVARVATLGSSQQAEGALALIQSLLKSEPHLQTASHNAWGYRANSGVGNSETGDVREVCQDDGETGCGEFILRLMREAGVVGAVVVLSRWFGGEMLGPDRWRLMRHCVTEALSERLRIPQCQAGHDGVALWGLDIQRMSEKQRGRSGNSRNAGDWNQTVIGAAIHQPESARSYLLKSFALGRLEEQKKQSDARPLGMSIRPERNRGSKSEAEAERLQCLGKQLGALRLLFESWAGYLRPVEMDRRAWSWYMAVRPDVDPGPSGWGAKGWLNLSSILDLRRPENKSQLDGLR